MKLFASRMSPYLLSRPHCCWSWGTLRSVRNKRHDHKSMWPASLHQESTDVLNTLSIDTRLKVLQLSVVYPKTTAKIREEMALCEGKYSGDIESYRAAIKEVLQSEELLALGVRPSIEEALQGIALDGIGFGLEAVDYVIIQRIGTFLVRLENTSPRSRARSGRTLFIDVTYLRHAASNERAKKLLGSQSKGTSIRFNWVAIGMGVLGMVPIIIQTLL